MRGAGRVVRGIFLLIVGTLNIIYGIGALADANFYANDTGYILTNLNTLGWVLIIVGVLQSPGLLDPGGEHLRPGHRSHRRQHRRDRGAAVDGQPPPLVETLAIFALCVWVVYGIIVFDPEEPAEVGPSPRA